MTEPKTAEQLLEQLKGFEESYALYEGAIAEARAQGNEAKVQKYEAGLEGVRNGIRNWIEMKLHWKITNE